MAPTPRDLPGFAEAYPTTRNRVLADRYKLSVSQIRNRAAQLGLKKVEGFAVQFAREAYLASVPKADRRTLADWTPRYPSPIYCELCGLSNDHLPGCTSTPRHAKAVAPPCRIRRPKDERVAA